MESSSSWILDGMEIVRFITRYNGVRNGLMRISQGSVKDQSTVSILVLIIATREIVFFCLFQSLQLNSTQLNHNFNLRSIPVQRLQFSNTVKNTVKFWSCFSVADFLLLFLSEEKFSVFSFSVPFLFFSLDSRWFLSTFFCLFLIYSFFFCFLIFLFDFFWIFLIFPEFSRFSFWLRKEGKKKNYA